MDKSTAKEYNKIKLIISLTGILIELLFWILIIATGLSYYITNIGDKLFLSPLLRFYFFVVIIGAVSLIIGFPLSFYSDYIIEHRYSVSNQTFFNWLVEKFKALIVGLVLGAVVLTIFYLMLRYYTNYWWLGTWIFLFLFSVLLSRLAPTLIFPLFYKFESLDNPEIKDKISKLSKKYRLNVTGIFQFNLSKTTKKANAAFTGLGKSKRVILGDTLLKDFNTDEIETIFAHEIGHYVNRHLMKGIFINGFISLAGLYLVFTIYNIILSAQNLIPYQLEALPYLGLLFLIYTQLSGPLSNYISRRFEYQADSFAVKTTGKIEIYKNSLQKLSKMNLADEEPHPLVEFLFYSHPSIKHRIEKIIGEKHEFI